MALAVSYCYIVYMQQPCDTDQSKIFNHHLSIYTKMALAIPAIYLHVAYVHAQLKAHLS